MRRKNLKINYKIVGKGIPIIFLHGWGGSLKSFEKIKSLSARGFKLFLLDLPGFGKSESPNKPWDLNDYACFLKNFAEKVRIKRFFLFGHSFGGRIAIKFATLYPDKVKGLILSATPGVKSKKIFKKTLFLFLAKIGHLIFFFPPLFFFKKLARRFLYFLAREYDYYKASPVMKKTIQKVVAEDLRVLLPQITQSTLILWGEKDKIVPLKIGLIMEKEIPKAELKIFPTTHGIFFQKPKEVVKEIADFCKKNL